MSKLYLDMAAEKEADDIGRKFMNSTDVVGDMSRAYGADLSSVKIHTDDGAAQQAAERGVDAFSTGKDVFFARNVFNQSDPDSRGILAHELAHSLQQGVGGDMGGMGESVQQSAPEGAPQGLFFANHWRRHKKRKAEEEALRRDLETISEPTLVRSRFDMSKINQAASDSTTFGDKGKTGSFHTRTNKADGSTVVREFLDYDSLLLNELVQGASREQLQDPKLRELVLNDYNKNMNARMRKASESGRASVDAQMRGGAGELNTLNVMLGSFLPEDLGAQMLDAYKNQGVQNQEIKKKASGHSVINPIDTALGLLDSAVTGNEELMDYMGGLAPSFEGVVDYGEDEEEQASMMVNNLILRVINPGVDQKDLDGLQMTGSIQKAVNQPDRGALLAGAKSVSDLKGRFTKKYRAAWARRRAAK